VPATPTRPAGEPPVAGESQGGTTMTLALSSGPWAWALMGFCKKPAQPWPLTLSRPMDKPITKCSNYEREPRESNISRLYIEMGV